MQIKTTMRFHYTCTRMAKIKREKKTYVGEDGEYQMIEFFENLSGIFSLNKWYTYPSNSTTTYLPKIKENMPTGRLKNAHISSFIYKSLSKQETMQMALNRRYIQSMCDIYSAIKRNELVKYATPLIKV